MASLVGFSRDLSAPPRPEVIDARILGPLEKLLREYVFTVTMTLPACGWRIRKNSIYRSIFMSREPEPSAKFSRWRA